MDSRRRDSRVIFKFSQALVIAVILVLFAYIAKQLTAERIFLIVFYLLAATVIPWLMVPLGIVAIIWSLFKTPAITGWLTSLGRSTQQQ